MRVAAVIGSPVAHSLSPAIHRAAFAAAGLDWSYVAFDVAAGRGSGALAAMRSLGIAGYSVTTPLKDEIAAAVDELAPQAATLGAVNTVVSDDGRLVGHSTDGDGLVASLAAEGVELAERRVVVVGAGGAARSVIVAVAAAGASEVAVVNRSSERREAAASLADAAWAVDAADVDETIAAAAVVINATSVGFGASVDDNHAVPLDARLLGSRPVVVDLVYHPLETPLLRAAAAAGCTVVDGLGMLIHQAVLQQQLWTGHTPDPGVMRAAALAELQRR